jgi:hypothetical protein
MAIEDAAQAQTSTASLIHQDTSIGRMRTHVGARGVGGTARDNERCPPADERGDEGRAARREGRGR